MSHDLELRWGYYNDPQLRPRLNAFAREAFNGLDFGPWNGLGIELAQYTPFSLFQGDSVAANVSASPLTLVLNGQRAAAVQLGTVATRPELRRRGLIRELISRAHAHWESQGRRLFFLFANPGSAQFYQQFGYRQVPEHLFEAPAPQLRPPAAPGRLLELSQPPDRELLLRLAQRRAPISQRLGVKDQAWLLAFHAVTLHAQRLLYIRQLDALAISAIHGNTLHLIDVLSERPPTLAEVYPYVGAPQVERIEFHFIPDALGLSELSCAPDADSLLFVRGPFAIEAERLRFPDTSQA